MKIQFATKIINPKTIITYNNLNDLSTRPNVLSIMPNTKRTNDGKTIIPTEIQKQPSVHSIPYFSPITINELFKSTPDINMFLYPLDTM